MNMTPAQRINIGIALWFTYLWYYRYFRLYPWVVGSIQEG